MSSTKIAVIVTDEAGMRMIGHMQQDPTLEFREMCAQDIIRDGKKEPALFIRYAPKPVEEKAVSDPKAKPKKDVKSN